MQMHRPLPMGHHYLDIPTAQHMVVVNRIMVLLKFRQHIVLVVKLLITQLTLQLKSELWELIRVLFILQRLQIMV